MSSDGAPVSKQYGGNASAGAESRDGIAGKEKKMAFQIGDAIIHPVRGAGGSGYILTDGLYRH